MTGSIREQTVIVGNRWTVRSGNLCRCPGCGEWFTGPRGVLAHMTSRHVTMDCRPFPEQVQ